MSSFWCGDFEQITRTHYELEVMNKSVDELEITTRVSTAMVQENIRTIGEVIERTEGEWLRTPNFGRKSLNDLKAALERFNVHLKPVDGF